MRQNPYIVQALKFATLTILGLVVVIFGAAFLRQTDSSTLTGRLVPQQQQGVTPTMRFEADRMIDGFSAPADTNVIFTVPSNVPRIATSLMVGGADHWQNDRYWGYCYSGNEGKNKAKGLKGKDMYDGRYFYSMGERKAQTVTTRPADNDLEGILKSTTQLKPAAPASIAEILYAGQTCYVMTSTNLPMGIDEDGDDLNSELERNYGTDSHNPDSDGDGIPDGTEVFVSRTDPHQADTDHDGLWDRCEDKNADGQVQKGDTSPLLNDTDRDGLCDGDGMESGCPEPKQNVCENVPGGGLNCNMRPSSPVYGEDMNQSCSVDDGETDPANPQTFDLPDWDYKFNKLQGHVDNAQGQDAPEFPIPGLPVGQ